MHNTIDRIELPPRPSSAGDARRFVDRALARLGIADRETGTLLTSELVTNAVLYSDGGIVVEVHPQETSVRISVRDESARPVRPRDVAPEATSGRGMSIVRRMATDWGVDELPGGGKSVWFEVPR
ncbi:MAG: ATP-binding protein [Acidobacteria bacterium]|nr:ATP-binding protein [Acidobacteriota bacterium]